MHPIIFSEDLPFIGKFTLHSFGVMMMLGFLVPTIFMRRAFQEENLDPDLASTISVAAIIGGVIGARLYFIVEHWGGFVRAPFAMIFSGAGLVWYGGLIGGVLTVTWAVKHYQMPFWKTADIVATLVLLGQAFGRMGCLLAADGDYGPPTDVPWAMSFPNGAVPTTDLVHPTPIYDMILLLASFFILWPMRRRNLAPGTLFGLYFIAVGVGRFITEFWRTTPKILFGWMTLAQIISVALVALGLVLVYYRQRARKSLG
jgi:phosphatidylglycerol:prolipoprotein diacylglycerol transferase